MATFLGYLNISKISTCILKSDLLFGPASARSYKIGVIGNNWLVGWLVGWLVTQFSQKRLQGFF